MFIPIGQPIRLPVRLIDEDGNGVTGMLPNHISDGNTVGNATVIKGNGAVGSLVLVNDANWFEIDEDKAPGLYHVRLPNTLTNVEGPLQLSVFPASDAFRGTVITAQVALTNFNFFGIGTETAGVQLTRAVDARTIEIVFDRRVNEAQALNPDNYEVSPALEVVSVQKRSDFHYRLTTGQQTIDQLYTVTISNIEGA